MSSLVDSLGGEIAVFPKPQKTNSRRRGCEEDGNANEEGIVNIVEVTHPGHTVENQNDRTEFFQCAKY